jgi:uncharacterized protein
MLNLSLAAIARGGAEARWEIPADHPLWEGAGLTLLEPVRVRLEARPIGDGGVLLRGRLQTALQLACRRCLGFLTYRIDEPLELLFEPLAAGERDALEGEVYPLPERGAELELSEVLREQLLLHVPEYVLCDEACRGLCPHCGADRNRTACSCVPERGPSPWDALKNLKFD